MRTIIGRFTEISRAHAAIEALLRRKYDAADISYVGNDGAGEADVPEARRAKATGGAGLGLLIGAGIYAIPGVGPLLAAGPLAVGLVGATADAATDQDSLVGALVEAGVPERDARAYGETVRRGGALVLMGARESVADNITAILRSSGAVAVDWHLRDPRSSGA